MKLNEFKKQKLDELDLSSFIGDVGSAAVRSGANSLMGKNALSTKDQLAQDLFVKKFVTNTISNLQNAIEGGIVTPGPVTVAPAASQNPAKQNPTQPPAAGNTPQQASTDTTVQPQSPEEIRKAKQAQATQAARAQMTPKSAAPVQPSPEEIRKAKQAQATQAARAQMTPKPTNEGRFEKLDSIFESIMRIDEAETVSDYIQAAAAKFASNSPAVSKYAPQIKQQADAIQNMLGSGSKINYKAIAKPLSTLAKMLYSLPDVATTSAQGENPSDTGPDELAIKNAVAGLNQKDKLALLNKIETDLKLPLSKSPSAPSAPDEEDDNPNIVRGYNESKR